MIPIPVTPLTLPDWQQAYRDGASPAALLGALRGRLAARERDVAVIRLISDAELQARLAALDAAAAKHADRAALLAALPLFGVPFAVKDNIDIAGIDDHRRLPGLRAPRRAQRHRRAAARGRRRRLDRQDQPRPVRHRPGRHALALRPAGQRAGAASASAAARARARRCWWRAATCRSRSAPTPPARAACRPASTSIVGLKPTPGRVSTAGVVPACRSLDCVSVFAHTVDDAAGVLAVHRRRRRRPTPTAASRPARRPGAPRLRVGVPGARRVLRRRRLRAAPGRGRASGCAALGHTRRADRLRAAARGRRAALRRPLGRRAPRRGARRCSSAQPEAFDATVRRVIERALGMSATDAFVAQYRLRELAQQARHAVDGTATC